VEVNVPCNLSVPCRSSPTAVRLLPVPDADSATGAPVTAFPNASSTVTVIVEALAPLLAVMGLGLAVADD